jgi:thiamine pyrophosphate-dependent acetolactate synthase large subunit-like protein
MTKTRPGSSASRVATVTDFDTALQAALARKGPMLIEAVVPPFKPG